MDEVTAFLREAGVYYLATTDGDQPRVRPFGTAHIFEDKLYFQTGNVKPVYKQLIGNPKVELSATKGDEWIRIEATAVLDDRREARVSMLDDYTQLQANYSADDGVTAVFYLKDATATFYSFTEEPKVIKF
jgi:uncharacterized pyridoxamine 5'-phosphate oxidase family protein